MPGVHFFQADVTDATNFPVGGIFDVISMVDSFEHIPMRLWDNRAIVWKSHSKPGYTKAGLMSRIQTNVLRRNVSLKSVALSFEAWILTVVAVENSRFS